MAGVTVWKADRSEFNELLEQVRAGSQEAGWKLVEIYGPAICRAVRARLPKRIRAKYDTGDFVQAVWQSFFTRTVQVEEFSTPDQLIAFLVTMARNKVIDEHRRFMSQKKQVEREVPLVGPAARQLASSDPTPSAVATARELWSTLMANQPSHYKRIIQLRYEGRTFPDIAAAVGMNERHVRRVLHSILESRIQ